MERRGHKRKRHIVDTYARSETHQAPKLTATQVVDHVGQPGRTIDGQFSPLSPGLRDSESLEVSAAIHSHSRF